MTDKPSSAKAHAFPGLAQQLQGRGPQQRQTARVVVGLDYGTSATKVVVAIDRGAGRERQALPLFGLSHAPSVLALHPDQTVELGEPANLSPQQLDAQGIRLLRSLKMRLREAVLDGKPGRVDGVDAPVRALVWAYLVRVVVEVERQLAALLPASQWDVRTVWHLGVPMIGTRQPQLEQAFRELLHRAVHRPAGNELPFRLPIAEVAQRYAEAARTPCPPSTTSDCLAFAEAAVALSAIQLHRGRLEPGHYFVCDVGAGTTDLAFFWYSSAAVDTPINFYSTECVPWGGDRFFAQVLAGLQKLKGEQAHAEARARLHSARAADLKDLSPFERILDHIGQARGRAFRAAHHYEELARWKRVTGFLVGGGAAMPGVRRRLGEGLETFVPEEEVSVYLRTLDLHKTIPGATPLHWIALGLSLRSQEMELYSPPESTPPLRHNQSGRILRPLQEERDDSTIK